jgi:predicted short-subunit dehydrogenase-like oxidoreductase (DUF2520 family)
MSVKKVVVIGGGNTATNFIYNCEKKGIEILGIYCKSYNRTLKLAKQFQCEAFTSVCKVPPADLYLIAVSDSAIADVADKLEFDSGLVVHTSGSTSIEVLTKHFKHCGVIYPLQTLTQKEPIDFSDVPLLIEAGDDFAKGQIETFTNALSNKWVYMDSAERRKMHLAAVMVNNFVNHLYALTKDFTEKEDLDTSLLEPLMRMTLDRATRLDPRVIQTGPARRNDMHIINEHLKLLNGKHGRLSGVYEFLSNSLRHYYQAEDQE